MNSLDAARLDLIRAAEAYMRAGEDAGEDMLGDGHVTDIVVVVQHTPDGNTMRRAVFGASGFRAIPVGLAADLLEIGFHHAYDQRHEP